jgi:prevent-host-death family protein
MKTVAKHLLKAKMLAYFREIEATGEPIIVTSHGKPVLTVAPYAPPRSPDEVFADVRGTVSIPDSVMEPETDEWNEA